MKPYYEHAGITIYHGDCREILPELPKVDLVLTDPPYGINAGDQRRQKSRTKMALATDYGANDWDCKPVDFDLLWNCLQSGTKAICFGGNFYSFPRASRWLVWDKDNTGDFADCELAWTNLGGAVRRVRYRWNGMLQEPGFPKEKRVHPTQKPIAVMRWAIGLAFHSGTILDPFMGSGTTLVAAKQLGRKAIGIEIEEKYCEIAVKRLSQEVLPLSIATKQLPKEMELF
jgi:site-specific DNA-methyltransferase (adenine-specific)